MPIFRHDDLKTMLDSSKDNLKLDAMKRMIGVSGTKEKPGVSGDQWRCFVFLLFPSCLRIN